jgi:amino acid permease
MDGSVGAPPDGGFADPEAVLGTDLPDASMPGALPNAPNRTPRASRAFVAAVVSLTMTAVGSVVLSLPQVFAECGAVGGVAALAGFAALTDASLVILARAARSTDARTYEQTVTNVVGPTGGKVVRVCLVVLLFGTLVSLQIIAADLAAPVVEAAMYGDKPGFWSSRLVINTAVFLLVYPLSLLENLSQLATASSGAFVVMLGVAGVLVARFAKAGFPVADDVVVLGSNPRAIALALPVGALAFTCHFNVVEISRELRKAKAERLETVDDDRPANTRDLARDEDGETSSAFGVFGAATRFRETKREDDERVIRIVVWFAAFPFYVLFATVGYLGFGRGVSGDVLTEWIGDGEMAAAQIAVAAVNVLKYPLMGFALRGIVVAAADDAYARLFFAGRDSAETTTGDALGASLLDEEGEDEEEEPLVGEGSASAANDAGTTARRNSRETEKKGAPRFVRAAALCVLHASIALCAVVLRRLALVLDLIGATCGVTVAFIVPGWVLWSSLEKKNSRGGAEGGGEKKSARLGSRVLAATLVAAGVATSACGVAAVVAEMV